MPTQRLHRVRVPILLALMLSLAWPGFAHDETVLIEAWVRDNEDHGYYPVRTLEGVPGFTPGPASELSAYGGRADTTWEATGFFRVQQEGDRWWLVDPDGHPYFHIAPNAVRPPITPSMIDDYHARYGNDATWAQQGIEQLVGWGFNGTGAWSTDELNRQRERPLPYTPIWNFAIRYTYQQGEPFTDEELLAYREAGLWWHNRTKGILYVFEPSFEAFVREEAEALRETADDPALLGHFSDNELPFGYGMLDLYLDLPQDSGGYAAASAWLAEQRGDSEQDDITEAEWLAWHGVVAERYFQVVASAIREADPNHLYLGPRLHAPATRRPPVFEAAGRHCDIVAVNVYQTWHVREALDQWYGWADAPLMITEFYARGEDTGMDNTSGSGWNVHTQDERGLFYEHVVLESIESGVTVGWHWFRYLDNDPLELDTDPSNRNSNKGVIDLDLEPYTPLVERMQRIHEQTYRLADHFDAQP